MKHRVTRELFDYWDSLRGGRGVPDRADLDPGAIRSCLADTFVLHADPAANHPFRIAGTAICALFGRELTRIPFNALWSTGDRPAVADMIRAVVDDADGAVAEITAHNTNDEAIGLELILLPMTCADEGASRILGALTALASPYWLGARPLQALHLGPWRPVGASSRSVPANILRFKKPARAGEARFQRIAP